MHPKENANRLAIINLEITMNTIENPCPHLQQVIDIKGILWAIDTENICI